MPFGHWRGFNLNVFPSWRWERWANCNRRSGQTVSELAKRCGGRSPNVFDGDVVLRIPVNHLFLMLKLRIREDFVFLTKHPEAFGPWPLLAFMMKTFSKKPRRGQKVAGRLVQISASSSLSFAFYRLDLFGVSLKCLGVVSRNRKPCSMCEVSRKSRSNWVQLMPWRLWLLAVPMAARQL